MAVDDRTINLRRGTGAGVAFSAPSPSANDTTCPNHRTTQRGFDFETFCGEALVCSLYEDRGTGRTRRCKI